MHNTDRMKVLGALSYKIDNIVYEHYHWVIYERHLRCYSEKSSNPILFHRVTPLGFVTHVYLCLRGC